MKKINKKERKELLEKLAGKLAPSVKVKDLLIDTLGELRPSELKEIVSRLDSPKNETKVRSEEGCYKLLIGGKKGKPYELMLRD